MDGWMLITKVLIACSRVHYLQLLGMQELNNGVIGDERGIAATIALSVPFSSGDMFNHGFVNVFYFKIPFIFQNKCGTVKLHFESRFELKSLCDFLDHPIHRYKYRQIQIEICSPLFCC